MMTSPLEIETARLIMMKARDTLETYEARKDSTNPRVHTILLTALKKPQLNTCDFPHRNRKPVPFCLWSHAGSD